MRGVSTKGPLTLRKTGILQFLVICVPVTDRQIHLHESDEMSSAALSTADRQHICFFIWTCLQISSLTQKGEKETFANFTFKTI